MLDWIRNLLGGLHILKLPFGYENLIDFGSISKLFLYIF